MISNNAKTEKPHIIHQIITLTCKNIIQKLIYNNHFKGSNIEILSTEVPPRVVINSRTVNCGRLIKGRDLKSNNTT